ncbi:MAG TPA: M3 family metallopeptidase [Vicinamibacterales bacterium]|nr:M3 family metallopeptidase [Vicinamibacterales bacterium]
MSHTNVLMQEWSGPYGGVPPWDRVKAEDFPEALEAALADEQATVAGIASNPDPPTFANTIEALERTGTMRDRVLRIFNVMRLNMSDPDYRALDREWQPRLAAAADAILFTPGLFERIDAVHAQIGHVALDPDQERLVTRVWDSFVRSGARLDASDRQRLSAINQQLASLYADFRAKVLADENTWTLLTTADDLAGLPAGLVAAAAAAAGERGLSGWAILNTRSSVDPFLSFSARRDLREVVWRRFKSRGDNGDANDTNDTITRIVRLRAERVALLGFPSHAHWQMADSMAGSPDAARGLLMQVWPAAVAQVRDEVAQMQALAATEDPALRIEPWDYLYYAERVRQAEYDIDVAQLSAYFELGRMLEAAMWSAEQRYAIAFREISGTVPVFHPDVRVWEVRDVPSGAHRGLYYFDTYARTGKRSGAWASNYRTQYRMAGGATAIASNNNNFLKGTPGEPSLVSLDDVRTLFHEFGHSLHALLQDVRYPTLAGTPRDFVELPSQINEQWVFTRELLDRFARHVQTGEPLALAMIEKVKAAETFSQGFKTVEAVSAAILDLELHTRADGVFDPKAFERQMLEAIGMPREIALRHRLPHFDHLFGSDAYSGLYYSYLWADVMAADGWQAFLEAGGPWNQEVARRFRTHILSDGNSIDRAEAYRRFRGRDPQVAALLEERGLGAANR